MHDIIKLKEMLCDELETYGRKGDLSAGELEIVDKLAHAVKNLDKVIEMGDEDEYSGRGPYYGTMAYRGGSYARGRGRNARRDSMGRYSREYSREGYSRAAEDMVDQLRDMMDNAPDEQTKTDIRRIVEKLERA